MNDKDIVKYILNNKHAMLSFLRDEDELSNNNKYYGYLYFMLDLKGDDTSDIIARLREIYGELSAVYVFLGGVASEIYSTQEQVAADFYRKALDINPKNIDALCELTLLECNERSFFDLLGLCINCGDYFRLNSLLSSYYYFNFTTSSYSCHEWKVIIDVLLNKQVANGEGKNNLLILAYHALGDLEKLSSILNDVEHIHLPIAKCVYSTSDVFSDLIASKVYDFNLSALFDFNYSLVYKELCGRYQLGVPEKNIPLFIKCAFLTDEYLKVVECFYHESPTKNGFNLECELYYLISLIFLKKELDAEVLSYVKKNFKFCSDDSRLLFKLFECAGLLNELDLYLTENKFTEHSIRYLGQYQEINGILEDANVVRHPLYERLNDMLAGITSRWQKRYVEERLRKLKSDSVFENGDLDALYVFCQLNIQAENYDLVISELTEYQKMSSLSIYLVNMLGVCFERKGLLEEAHRKYSECISLMKSCDEYSYNIIGNYLTLSEKLNVECHEYDFLRDKFNLSLLGDFVWSRHLSNDGNKLYKYYPLNVNTIDSLINGYFYFPDKTQLNDPIEMPEMNSVGHGALVSSQYRICSFSKNSNSMLMWSHYTQEHTGIMVEYEFNDGLPQGVGVGEVTYVNDAKRNKELDNYIFNQFLLTKNSEWAYEQEVRLISYDMNKVFFGSYEYPKPDRTKVNAKIVSITLGYKFPSSKIDLIERIVSSLNATRKKNESVVLIRRAIISDDNMFKINYI